MQPVDATTLLQQLRDIHSPPPIGWWPLAIGWWIIIGLSFLILICFAYYYWRKRRPTTLRIALALITQLQQKQQQQPDYNHLPELSIIVRRVALARFPNTDVAHLHSEAWLRFLDKTGRTIAFTQGAGKCLAYGPYQQQTIDNFAAVLTCVRDWVKTIYV